VFGCPGVRQYRPRPSVDRCDRWSNRVTSRDAAKIGVCDECWTAWAAGKHGVLHTQTQPRGVGVEVSVDAVEGQILSPADLSRIRRYYSILLVHCQAPASTCIAYV
jgi:hypothetical protein